MFVPYVCRRDFRGLGWDASAECVFPSHPGAVEFWELDENETLIVNKFCKYEHDNIVTTVSVLANNTQAASGSKDFR